MEKTIKGKQIEDESLTITGMLKKGCLFGVITGLVATFSDSLFMLDPRVFIPHSYPFMLISFNIVFWMIIGFLSGMTLWLFSKKILLFKNPGKYLSALVFIIPFAIIYGVMGKTVIMWSKNMVLVQLLPGFDHNLSFLWVALIVLVMLLRLKANKTVQQFVPTAFIPELLAIMLLFQLCSNLQPLLRHHGLANPVVSLNIIYALIVLIAFGLYLILSLTIKTLYVKRFAVTAMLFFIVCCSLGGTFLAHTYIGNRIIINPDGYSDTAIKQAQGITQPPNVILIVLDTVRADRLSIYGNRVAVNNLEKIAREALVFENCIASSSWTLPSHASLFTGMYPVEHGAHIILKHESTLRGFPIPRRLSLSFETLAELFSKSGYQTVAVSSNTPLFIPEINLHQGFHSVDRREGIGAFYFSYPFHPIFHVFCVLTNIMPKHSILFRTAEDMNQNTFPVLERISTAPFFLFLNYMDAHAPYRPPRPFDGYFLKTAFPQLHKIRIFFLNSFKKLSKQSKDSFLLSQYDGELAYLDHHLGNLFSRLKELDIFDSSLIVITSDHGELFGHKGLYEHKGPLYDGVVRVPLLIKFPFSRITGRNRTMMTLSDLLPTILKVCDIPIPADISAQQVEKRVGPVVTEFYDNATGEHRALYYEKYKLMQYGSGKSSELYDLERDPGEKINLAEKFPDVTAALQEKLTEWKNKHKPQWVSKDTHTTESSDELRHQLKALGYIQ